MGWDPLEYHNTGVRDGLRLVSRYQFPWLQDHSTKTEIIPASLLSTGLRKLWPDWSIKHTCHCFHANEWPPTPVFKITKSSSQYFQAYCIFLVADQLQEKMSIAQPFLV